MSQACYGIDIVRLDGTKDGFMFASRVTREGAFREAREAARRVNVRYVAVLRQIGPTVSVMAKFASSDGERVRSIS